MIFPPHKEKERLERDYQDFEKKLWLNFKDLDPQDQELLKQKRGI